MHRSIVQLDQIAKDELENGLEEGVEKLDKFTVLLGLRCRLVAKFKNNFESNSLDIVGYAAKWVTIRQEEITLANQRQRLKHKHLGCHEGKQQSKWKKPLPKSLTW